LYYTQTVAWLHIQLDTRGNDFDTDGGKDIVAMLHKGGVSRVRYDTRRVHVLQYVHGNHASRNGFLSQEAMVKTANERLVTVRWDLVIGGVVLLIAVIMAVMEIIHWF
jgi:hypothetical protein